MRIGQIWISVLWAVPLGATAVIVLIAVAQSLIERRWQGTPAVAAARAQLSLLTPLGKRQVSARRISAVKLAGISDVTRARGIPSTVRF